MPNRLKINCRFAQHVPTVARFGCIALAFVALLARAGIAFASNGDDITVPIVVPVMTGPMNPIAAPAYSKQSGLQIRVNTSWAGMRGYRPVTVTASTPKPTTADTQITIAFQAGGWRSGQRSMRVEADFELPQGATSASTTFSVPQYSDWNSCSWEVWVDGAKDEELCMPGMGFNSGAAGGISVGILESDQASISALQLFNEVSNGAVESYTFDFANLPESWVEYSTLDIVATNVATLERLFVSNPGKLTQLLRWVHAGGNLWVIDVGQDFANLPALEKVLQSQRDAEFESSTDEEISLDRWHFLNFDESGPVRLKDVITLSLGKTEGDTELTSREILSSTNPELAADSRLWFIARSWGLGTIVALQERDNRRGRRFGGAGAALRRSSLAYNLNWATRHGNEPAVGNPEFNNLLIPDVGLAPVFEFQMLITLFAIAIGPLNYWLLKRRNQLPLLLITVPVAALGATLLLFSYGLVADGFGTRVRVRSLTMLDQRAGEAACWARMSYYAGIAPSDGLKLPDDTTFYPIQPARSEYSAFGRRSTDQQRSLQWNKDQDLTRGWLASRTPTQYLSIAARPTGKSLQFAAEGDQLSVTNQLGTTVTTLIVQDHQGRLFIGEAIEPDVALKLTPSTHIEALAKFRLALTENLPQMPNGYVADGNNRRRRRDYGTPVSNGLMELQLEALVSPLAIDWGDGTYIAVTASGIELSLGLEDAVETNSFHVVRGAW